MDGALSLEHNHALLMCLQQIAERCRSLPPTPPPLLICRKISCPIQLKIYGDHRRSNLFFGRLAQLLGVVLVERASERTNEQDREMKLINSNQFKQVAFIALCCSCLLLVLVQDLTNFLERSLKREGGKIQEDEDPEETWWNNATATNDKRKLEGQDERKTQVFSPFEAEFKLTNGEIDKLSDTSQREVMSSRDLLNLVKLTYVIEPTSQVKCAPNDGNGLRLLIVVNSRWSNSRRRQRLRSDWLNKVAIGKAACLSHSSWLDRVEFAFVLGEAGSNETSSSNQRAIEWEANRYGDLLVLGGLLDEYRSLSLKHLSLIKWIIQTTDPASMGKTLVLKCDDDASIDLSQLLDRLPSSWPGGSGGGGGDLGGLVDIGGARRSFDETGEQVIRQMPANWIMCARFPAHTRVIRRPDRKWRLSKLEYPFDTFPAYCSGLAYLAPLSLLRRLLILAHQLHTKERLQVVEGASALAAAAAAAASEKNWRRQAQVRPLWVDDVYVTGVLAASLADPLEVIRLNAYYCYTMALQSRRAKLGAPCMVSERD